MTRHTYAAAESAAAASDLQYRLLVNIGVTSSTLYACTGDKYIYTLGNTYTPVGGFGGIEPVEDQSDVQPRTLRFWLQAVGSADLYEPAREDMFNRPVVIYRAYLDTQTNAVVSTPDQHWRGFINKVDIHFNDEERGNFFEVEAETALRRNSEVTNFTKEAHWTVLQQSGDTFFNYLHQVPLTKALWGNQPTTFNGASPAGGSWVPRLIRNIVHGPKSGS
jgi:hypothetical protein